MKTCTKCHESKPLSAFGKSSVNKDGYRYDCNSCRAQAQKEYRKKHPEKQWAIGLMRYWNMTLEEFDQLLSKQGGGCAICGGINLDGRQLCVDHNHKTGAVRGLLCNSCNAILGYAEDNPALLRKALFYLEQEMVLGRSGIRATALTLAREWE